MRSGLVLHSFRLILVCGSLMRSELQPQHMVLKCLSLPKRLLTNLMWLPESSLKLVSGYRHRLQMHRFAYLALLYLWRLNHAETSSLFWHVFNLCSRRSGIRTLPVKSCKRKVNFMERAIQISDYSDLDLDTVTKYSKNGWRSFIRKLIHEKAKSEWMHSSCLD